VSGRALPILITGAGLNKPRFFCVGSVASRKPLVDVTVYCTSKYGCLALTHCGAVALAEHNITINGYAPGVVKTPLWEQLDKDLVDSDYMTGQMIHIDGGWVIQ